jgi:hypothetical protein
MKYSLRLLAIVLFLSSAGCRRNSSLSEPIGKVVQSGARQLNMGRVTNFAWEDVFVFGPYTPKDEECQTLKHSESKCLYEGLRDVDESESLLVFLHDASVNRVESIPRTIADFDDNCLNRDFKRAAAEFIVEKRPRVYIVCR